MSQIRGLNPHQLNHSATTQLTMDALTFPTALSYHARQQQLYWAEEDRSSTHKYKSDIKRIYVNGSSVEQRIHSTGE